MTRLTERCFPTIVLGAALILTSPGIANATHDGGADRDRTGTAKLVVDVAEANQRLSDIGTAIQIAQEGVNKALVDVVNARDAEDVGRSAAQSSRQALEDTNADIAVAQERFDKAAASTYVNGPQGGPIITASPEDALATAAAGQAFAISFRQARTNLLRARTEKVNNESAARAAEQRAVQTAAEARQRNAAAVTALVDARGRFGAQQAEVNRLAAERDAARARLAAATTPNSTILPAPAPAVTAPVAKQATEAPIEDDRWATGTIPNAPRRVGDTNQWDTTLPMVPSANVVADPVAIINAVLQISSTSAQVTAAMGRTFLQKLGILPQAAAAADPGITNGRIPRVYGREASEFVIRRAMSQVGVPYSWGGGNANGPSNGIDQGAGTVGFDCSGLYLYAFAGVGIKLDHYSGSQYDAGRKVPSSQMRRGDLIFYGPNASQHEAMYLGEGQMLEAPFTGSQVRVAPVRTSGMMPFVTRLIDY